MKCPLLSRIYVEEPETISKTTTDCLKEECAWWYEGNAACAILTMAQGGIYLHKALLSLNSKIPLGEVRGMRL